MSLQTLDLSEYLAMKAKHPDIELTERGTSIVLARVCVSCEGTGDMEWDGAREDCIRCGGIGYLPTDEGLALLRFAALFGVKA